MTAAETFGFTADLDRAAAATDLRATDPSAVTLAALGLVTAWGYCRRTAGTPPPLADFLSPDQLRSAHDLFARQLARWTVTAESFADDWYDCGVPSDADDLCEEVLGRRTDVWAAEAAFAEAGMPVDATAFDAALREHEGVLATVVGFNWYENHVEPFRAAMRPSDLPWWLSDHLARVAAETDRRTDATLPPPEYFATVRRVRAWKAAEPAGVGIMAASMKPKGAQARQFVWQSPDGRTMASLDVVVRLTDEEKRTVPFPLIFELAPGVSAVELAGTPIRLGTVRGIIDANAEVSATVAAWWAESDGRLFVGSAEVEWPRVVTPEVPVVDT